MTTIADVAKAAGVSISTVSYVMSGKRTISPETKERVERAILELAYSPHASARSLASRTTHVIGLQAPLRSGVDVHVVMAIVAGIVSEARTHGYDILLLTNDAGSSLERAAQASRVDALLVMDVESDDPRLATLARLSVPSVLIGVPEGAPALGRMLSVDFDFEAAGRLAATRLAARGHRRVALIGAPAEVLDRHTSYADRLSRGFLDACAELGVGGTVHACPGGAEATGVITGVLEADPGITGVFIHNEAAMPHLSGCLIGRPGFDVIALSPADLTPHIRGVRELIDLPAQQLGVLATTTLQRLIASEPTEGVTLIPPHLIEIGA